jgi:hypothetical protein
MVSLRNVVASMDRVAQANPIHSNRYQRRQRILDG